MDPLPKGFPQMECSSVTDSHSKDVRVLYRINVYDAAVVI